MLTKKTALNAFACLLSEMRPVGLLDPSGEKARGGRGDAPEGETGTGLGQDAIPATNFHSLALGRLDSCMRLDSAAADAVMLLPDRRSVPHEVGAAGKQALAKKRSRGRPR